MGTERINQSTQEQNLRNAHQGISATVQGYINSGIDQIQETNYSLRGNENADARNARNAAIRGNTLSMIQGQLTPAMQYGGRLEQISPYVVSGDRNNRTFADYQHALQIQGGAAGALNQANNVSDFGKIADNPTGQQISDLQNKMQALINAVTAFSGAGQ